MNREGYVFDGWYTQATNGTKVETDTTVTITSTQMLYAHWNRIQFTIELKINGADFATKSITASGIELSNASIANNSISYNFQYPLHGTDSLTLDFTIPTGYYVTGRTIKLGSNSAVNDAGTYLTQNANSYNYSGTLTGSTIVNNIVYTVSVAQITYTLRYNPNGGQINGSSSVQTTTVTHNALVNGVAISSGLPVSSRTAESYKHFENWSQKFSTDASFSATTYVDADGIIYLSGIGSTITPESANGKQIEIRANWAYDTYNFDFSDFNSHSYMIEGATSLSDVIEATDTATGQLSYGSSFLIRNYVTYTFKAGQNTGRYQVTGYSIGCNGHAFIVSPSNYEFTTGTNVSYETNTYNNDSALTITINSSQTWFNVIKDYLYDGATINVRPHIELNAVAVTFNADFLNSSGISSAVTGATDGSSAIFNNYNTVLITIGTSYTNAVKEWLTALGTFAGGINNVKFTNQAGETVAIAGFATNKSTASITSADDVNFTLSNSSNSVSTTNDSISLTLERLSKTITLTYKTDNYILNSTFDGGSGTISNAKVNSLSNAGGSGTITQTITKYYGSGATNFYNKFNGLTLTNAVLESIVVNSTSRTAIVNSLTQANCPDYTYNSSSESSDVNITLYWAWKTLLLNESGTTIYTLYSLPKAVSSAHTSAGISASSYYQNGAYGYLTTATASVNVPTKTGYSFNGYYVSSASQYFANSAGTILTANFNPSSALPPESATQRWTQNEYELIVNMYNTSGVTPASPRFGVGHDTPRRLESGRMWFYYDDHVDFSFTPTYGGWYVQSYSIKNNSTNSVIASGAGTVNVSAEITESIDMPDSDVTVDVYFLPVTYNITFDPNDGSLNTTSQTATFDCEYGTLPSDPTQAGYTFVGWFTDSISGSQITSSTIVGSFSETTSDGNTGYTLYAHWTHNVITVTLNAPQTWYGYATGYSTRYVYYKYQENAYYSDYACTNQIDRITLLSGAGVMGSATNVGYKHTPSDETYIGTNGRFGEVAASDLYSSFSSDVTLDPIWEYTYYTITFTSVGSAPSKQSRSYTIASAISIAQESGCKYVLTNDSSTFQPNGWGSEGDVYTSIDFDTGWFGNVTLQITPIYTVSYYPGSYGSGTMASNTYLHGTNPTIKAYGFTSTDACHPFDRWINSTSAVYYTPGGTYMPNDNLTLVAQYSTSHNYQTTTSPTCYSTGVKTCSRCGATQTLSAVEHSFSTVGSEVSPTCTTGGYSRHYCVYGCGTYVDSDFTPALGHTAGTSATQTIQSSGPASNCVACGKGQMISYYVVCARCGGVNITVGQACSWCTNYDVAGTVYDGQVIRQAGTHTVSSYIGREYNPVYAIDLGMPESGDNKREIIVKC